MSGRAKAIILACVTIAALAAVVPAQASNVTVVLTVNYGPRTGIQSASAAACPVSVAEGANGLAVLDAGIGAGCIVSYATGFGGGYVTCISGVCEGRLVASAPICSYWAVLDNGTDAFNGGVLAFHADNGDVLAFSFGAPFTLPC
jgi:hypothetical protein